MNKQTENDHIENASDYSFRNKEFLKKSEKCGCYGCGEIFNPNTIEKWADEGETALCPNCGIDTVISSTSCTLTKELLEKMYHKWLTA